MKKELWHWERHDVVNYLRANLKEGEEFTSETLIRKIQKSGSGGYDFGYGERIISGILFQLVIEGHIQARYESVKMEPNNNYYTVTNSDNCKHRFGSKTVTVYWIYKS
jgi:hypothetical protein